MLHSFHPLAAKSWCPSPYTPPTRLAQSHLTNRTGYPFNNDDTFHAKEVALKLRNLWRKVKSEESASLLVKNVRKGKLGSSPTPAQSVGTSSTHPQVEAAPRAVQAEWLNAQEKGLPEVKAAPQANA